MIVLKENLPCPNCFKKNAKLTRKLHIYSVRCSCGFKSASFFWKSDAMLFYWLYCLAPAICKIGESIDEIQ